jgi:hypothetical protein
LQKSQISCSVKLFFGRFSRLGPIFKAGGRKSVSNSFMAKVVLNHKTNAMKTIINTTLLLLPVLVNAQDVLFKTDNTRMEVKVCEITETSIKYKLYNNPDGPYYIINKKDAAMVIYQNGTHEVFKISKEERHMPSYEYAPQYVSTPDTMMEHNKSKKFAVLTKNQNIAFFNLLGFGNSCFSGSYMREVKELPFLIHVPFSFSFAEPAYRNLWGVADNHGNVSNYNIKKKDFDLGLGGYIRTSGNRAVTHFVGPLYRYARFSGSYDVINYHYSSLQNSYETTTYDFTVDEHYFMINTGFLYHFTPNFNMMISAAVGSKVHREYKKNDPNAIAPNRSYSGSVIPAVLFGFNLGYRF